MTRKDTILRLVQALDATVAGRKREALKAVILGLCYSMPARTARLRYIRLLTQVKP